ILHGLEHRHAGRICVTARELSAEDDPSSSEPGMIEIEVSDDGEGLPAGFEAERSAGLGLSIVQSLVTEQLKGQLVVTARPGGGTVARVTLPRKG
ncbi:MAG: ATP-binding protein, partial [Chloroflexota bacterium]|nr:ATP-binding protein [Chloroflexota bacterium]